MTELLAAAERLRQLGDSWEWSEWERVYRPDSESSEGYTQDDMEASVNDDLHTLADFALSLLDATPIDETWLRSVGFDPCASVGSVQFFAKVVNQAVVRTAANGLCFVFDADAGRTLYDIATRGQLTALLFALGATK